MLFPFPFLNQIPQKHAFGMKDHQAGARFVVDLEQIQFAAQTPVVSLPGFLEQGQVIVERLFIGKAGAVNALQHLVSFIAAPVGARDA